MKLLAWKVFQMHISFRLETGLTWKFSLSFKFVAASRKKSFHIIIKSHNAKVKLQSLPVSWSIQWYCKLQNILLIFHVPSFYKKIHLVDVLSARTQTRFGIWQTVYFNFINRNVSIKQILLTCFNIFPFSCLHTEESSQSIKIQQIKWSI